MESQLNLKQAVGTGITPERFMESMQVRQMLLNGITDTKDRFKEIHRQFKWEREEDRTFFAEFGASHSLNCLILCTDWCPDVIWNVPVLFRIMEQARIPTEVLPMEDHPEIMDRFLTNGGRAQPIAAFLDDEGNVLGRWGARPAYIQSVMDRFKREHPDSQAEDYQERLNQTYKAIGDLYRQGSEYQLALIEELITLFSRFGPESPAMKGRQS